MLHLFFFHSQLSHARVRVGWNGFVCVALLFCFFILQYWRGKGRYYTRCLTLKSDETSHMHGRVGRCVTLGAYLHGQRDAALASVADCDGRSKAHNSTDHFIAHKRAGRSRAETSSQACTFFIFFFCVKECFDLTSLELVAVACCATTCLPQYVFAFMAQVENSHTCVKSLGEEVGTGLLPKHERRMSLWVRASLPTHRPSLGYKVAAHHEWVVGEVVTSSSSWGQTSIISRICKSCAGEHLTQPLGLCTPHHTKDVVRTCTLQHTSLRPTVVVRTGI